MASRLSRREVMQIAALAGLSPVALRAQTFRFFHALATATRSRDAEDLPRRTLR